MTEAIPSVRADDFSAEAAIEPTEIKVRMSGNADLVTKPLLEIHDDEWKHMVRDQLIALGPVLAAFDNEPTHINTYRQHFPEALCVHLATDESARGIAVHPDIPSVQNFILPVD